jgi:hypothetical protein
VRPWPLLSGPFVSAFSGACFWLILYLFPLSLPACLPALSRVCKSLDFDSFPIIVISDFEVCVQKRAQNGWLFRNSTTYKRKAR